MSTQKMDTSRPILSVAQRFENDYIKFAILLIKKNHEELQDDFTFDKFIKSNKREWMPFRSQIIKKALDAMQNHHFVRVAKDWRMVDPLADCVRLLLNFFPFVDDFSRFDVRRIQNRTFGPDHIIFPYNREIITQALEAIVQGKHKDIYANPRAPTFKNYRYVRSYFEKKPLFNRSRSKIENKNVPTPSPQPEVVKPSSNIVTTENQFAILDA